MTSISLLRLLSDFFKRIFSLQSTQAVAQRLLRLWGYLRRLLFSKSIDPKDRGLDRPSSKTVTPQPYALMSSSTDIICASRVPPTAYARDPTRLGPSLSDMNETLGRPLSMPPLSPSNDNTFLRPNDRDFAYPGGSTSGPHQNSSSKSLHEYPLDNRGRRPLRYGPPSEYESSRASSRASRLTTDTGPRARSRSARPKHRVDYGFTGPAKASTHTLAHHAEETAQPPAHPPLPPLEIPNHSDSTIAPKRKMYPRMSADRYERNIRLPKRDDDWTYTVQPVTLEYPRQNVPLGWEARSHPEGALYFYRTYDTDHQRIYTDANLCDTEIFHIIQNFTHDLMEYIQHESILMPSEWDLVLELEANALIPGDFHWTYYFVAPSKRLLFWVHPYDLTEELGEILGEVSPTHLRHELERYYWMHCETFPFKRAFEVVLASEITNIVTHAITDQLTSPTSTVLYSVDHLRTMLNIAKNAKNMGDNEHTVCVTSRLLAIFAHARFIHYHGEYGARLNRDQSVHGSKGHPRSWLIVCLAPVFFNAPMIHLQSLEKIWVDQTMSHLPWEQFIEKLKNDWQEFILYATVLLNANVAFLAIPSVDPENNAANPPFHPARSPAQVASYISIVTSVGSIIVGLLLVRQYRVRPKETVEEAANFLSSRTHPTRGVETLAILYSLPYALLFWGMLTFLCAFSIENFITSDHVPIYITSVAWGIVGCLILWCIYAAWEDDPVPLWQRIKEGAESRFNAVRTHKQEFMKKILPGMHMVPPGHPSTSHLPQTPSVLMATLTAAAAAATTAAAPTAVSRPGPQTQAADDSGEEDAGFHISVEPDSAVSPV